MENQDKAVDLVGEAAGGGVRLDRLECRVCALIERVEAPDEDASQLKAMGVCIGRKVEVVQRGDPLILHVLGSRIGVAGRLACRVYVEPCSSDGCETP